MKLYFLLITFIFTALCFPQSNNLNTEKFQYLSPVPSSGLHLPQTNIIIRQGEELSGVNINDTTLILVTGNISGKHLGSIFLTPDSKTLIFEPTQPFTKGESVQVTLKSGIKTQSGKNIDSLNYTFSISNGCTTSPSNENINLLKQYRNKKLYVNLSTMSNSDTSINLPINFPAISIKNKTNPENGYYFLGINQGTANYLSIFNNDGVPIFYRKISGTIYDFKLQPNGMLTYFDGNSGKFYGLDSLYQLVDSFYTGNGYFTDFHDLQVLENGNYFVISYDSEPVNMDTVVTGGKTDACVIGCVIQELDKNKRVVWQWRSWDHYNITNADPDFDLTQSTIQYCHINSIDVPDDNNIIFSVKHFNEITNVDRNTGKILWRLGGKKNQFTIITDPTSFKFQHDARYIGNGRISFFDNGKVQRSSSRGVIYTIDSLTKTATFFSESLHIPDTWSKVMGNVQITSQGNMIIGWGNTGGGTNYVTEFNQNGNITNDITLSNNNFVYSYRAFKFPWKQKLITSEKDSIIFNKISSGIDTTISIIVTNNSSSPINITGTVLQKSEFVVTNTFPSTIAANSSMTLSVKFTPQGQTLITDTLYIVSQTNEQMVALPLLLKGNADLVTSVEDVKIPTEFILYQNYPNPFNPSTNISYFLPQKSKVIIRLYNILGEEITTLVNKIEDKGKKEIIWTPINFSSGIYIYRLNANSIEGELHYTKSNKMLLLK